MYYCEVRETSIRCYDPSKPYFSQNTVWKKHFCTERLDSLVKWMSDLNCERYGDCSKFDAGTIEKALRTYGIATVKRGTTIEFTVTFTFTPQ